MRAVTPLLCTWMGVPIVVTQMTDSTSHRWVQHAYPGRDGVELEAMGAAPRAFEVEAVFYGPTWFSDYAVFAGMVEQPAPILGTFIHPFLGAIRGAITDLRVVHHDRRQDCAVASFVLTEGIETPVAFSVVPTLSSAASSAAASVAAASAAAAGLAA